MQEQVFENIDLKKAFVANKPTVKTITVNNGKNAGESVDVLEFKAFKPIYERLENGQFEQKGSVSYDVKLYGTEASKIGQLLQKGMAINVEGSTRIEKWTGEDGKEHSKNLLNASAVSLILSQQRIKTVIFQQRKAQQKEKS